MSKVHFQQAKFLISAAELSQLPEDTGIEVAFAGRSNAGKSTALNCLTNQKGLAKVSKTPGRTQLINVFEIDEAHRLIDLPGYGFAKVPKAVKQRWEKTLQAYLESRESLKGIVLLIDSRHPIKELDRNMIEWARACNLPMHILLTKADKLNNQGKSKALNAIKPILSPDSMSVQLFSSLKRTGFDHFHQKMDEWFGT